MTPRGTLTGMLLTAGVAMTSGCALTARISGGPSLDTHGNVGADVRTTFGFGTYSHPSGVLGTATLGGGSGDGGRPMFMTGAGLEVVDGDEDHHRRLGVLLSNRNYFGGDATSLFGAGVNAGYGLAAVGESKRGMLGNNRSSLTFGAEAQAELLGGDGARGVFSLPLVFEAFAGASL